MTGSGEPPSGRIMQLQPLVASIHSHRRSSSATAALRYAWSRKIHGSRRTAECIQPGWICRPFHSPGTRRMPRSPVISSHTQSYLPMLSVPIGVRARILWKNVMETGCWISHHRRIVTTLAWYVRRRCLSRATRRCAELYGRRPRLGSKVEISSRTPLSKRTSATSEIEQKRLILPIQLIFAVEERS